MKVNNILKDIKRRFVIFTLAGIILISFASYFTLSLHSQVVSRQVALQTMYYKVGRQLNLIGKISNLSQNFNKVTSGRDKITLADDLKGLLSNLNQESAEFTMWLSKNNFSNIANIESLLREKSVESEMREFIQKARELAYNEELNLAQTQAHMDYLNANSRAGLGEVFNFMSSRLEVEIDKAMSTLDNIAFLLVGICFLLVLLVWLLVFRPLYNTILDQHHKISDALLKAESANRSKTDFLANISHEIRTPMTAILGYTSLLKREEVSLEEREDSMNIIDKNANHLMGLIDEILDIAKMESGRFDFEKKEVDLVRLLNEVYSLINVKAEEKNIELIFKNTGKIPEKILSDEKRIKQILFNIIGNAIKFTHKGFVEVSVNFLEDRDQLSIRVKDTGVGLSTKQQQKLFRPFEQADTSVNRKYGGTGLGLVLSREMAHGLGGDVFIVDSEEGIGTTFEIQLAVGELKEDIKLLSSFSTSVIEAKEDASIKGVLDDTRILVVDDAKENARLFKIYLTDAGADVAIANDGDVALEKVSKTFFDIILLDLQMPGKDGFQVLRELRRKAFNKPIVAITAHAMKEEKEKTLIAGFDDHISKPVRADELVKSVSFHIKGRTI